MIDISKYVVILKEGLMLDHYFVLLNIKEGKEQPKNKRIQGFVNLLCKKGYINDGALTEKAIKLLGGEGNPTTEMPIRTTLPAMNLAKTLEKSEPDLTVADKFDYANWVINLHSKCEKKILQATGKRQVRDKIEGKGYSFLSNSTDLGRVILRAVNVYKLTDFDKIEKTILSYIDKCIKANKWFPLLNYYIMKNSMSPMVTDMQSEEEEEASGDDSIVNI